MTTKIENIKEFKQEIDGMIRELEQKAKWKELFYQNGQSRGKFAASPWTENIYPWLKGQLTEVLKSINSFEVGLRDEFDHVKNTEEENLVKLPPEVSVRVQTGWLLGYSDCWNKLRRVLSGE